MQQVINAAVNDIDFLAALTAVAMSASDGTAVSNDRLGRWLKQVEGKIINKFKLKRDGNSCGYPLWRLCRI